VAHYTGQFHPQQDYATQADMRSPRTILITGASSGIGAALARAYAAPGVVLYLGGRNPERLSAVAAACRERGAEVDAAAVDVTDREASARWILDCDSTRPLDIVVANAGISGGGAGAADPHLQTRRILATNIDGVVNTVLPALDIMRARARGQIAIMGSPAGFRGLPSAPAYSASKAAVRAWGEALRLRHAAEGVEICVIYPGFVESRMTENNPFPMPFLMDADRAAAIIRRRLERNRGCIAFPLPTFLAAWLVGIMPLWLLGLLMRRVPSKE